ncbi:phosphatase PAP2 family protein [Rhodovulum sp. YNF3179]|uniref:phosphatase PAP2 family protein n=1 Tax=Rhodovulum sp. YNF3179 TaxID=3425127 RepID=UPI003D3255F5
MAFVSLVRGNGPSTLLRAITAMPELAISIVYVHGATLGILVVPALLLSGRSLLPSIGKAAAIGFATLLFLLTFSLVKTTLPDAVPFYADRAFARVDAWLHGGRDPWSLTHEWMVDLPPVIFSRIYMEGWVFVSTFFPMLLVLLDPDNARRSRFLMLYLVGWVFLGNVLALAGMSAGPIYHDRLTGLEYFAGLDEALTSSGIAASRVGLMHDHLWAVYEGGRLFAGSGISAFPSVHVGFVALLALYLFERLPRLAPVWIATVLIFQFLSVHLGWHYAIDGYVSIALIVGLWWWMKRKARRRSHGEITESPSI